MNYSHEARQNILLLNFLKKESNWRIKSKVLNDWSGSSEAILIAICIYVMLLIKGAFHKGPVSSKLPHGAWLQRRRARESWGVCQPPRQPQALKPLLMICLWTSGLATSGNLLGALRGISVPLVSGKKVAASHVRPSGDKTWQPNQGTDNIYTHHEKLLEIRTYLSLSFLLTVHLPRPKFLTVFAFPSVQTFLSLFSRWETNHIYK